MHPNARLIDSFYQAFQRLDGEGMAACYHPQVTFSDPVFPRLEGAQAGAMWRMFCSAKDIGLEVTFSDVQADDTRGSARWEARYVFSMTGRKVHNVIRSSFELKDGKIIRHTDDFDFYRWSRMALGLSGVLLGWTPIVRNAVRKTARARLDGFIARQGAGSGR